MEEGKAWKSQGRLQVDFIFFKTWDTRKMELPCKETDYSGGQSCSGAKGRIGVWIGRHHATVAFTPLIADTEEGNSLRNINFIVARKKIVYKARH